MRVIPIFKQPLKLDDKWVPCDNNSYEIALPPGKEIEIEERYTHRKYRYIIMDGIKRVIIVDYNHPIQ